MHFFRIHAKAIKYDAGSFYSKQIHIHEKGELNVGHKVCSIQPGCDQGRS
jgi:hypothetical protein